VIEEIGVYILRPARTAVEIDAKRALHGLHGAQPSDTCVHLTGGLMDMYAKAEAGSVPDAPRGRAAPRPPRLRGCVGLSCAGPGMPRGGTGRERGFAREAIIEFSREAGGSSRGVSDGPSKMKMASEVLRVHADDMGKVIGRDGRRRRPFAPSSIPPQTNRTCGPRSRLWSEARPEDVWPGAPWWRARFIP
jgi:hypothetical protein